jgi:hypothetical protein
MFVQIRRPEERDYAGRGYVLRRVLDLPGGGGDLARGARSGGRRGELVAVNTDEEAQRLRFPGSPTIRVDGEDLFPMPDRAEYALGCRMYATPEGLKGSPTAEMLKDALTTEGVARA